MADNNDLPKPEGEDLPELVEENLPSVVEEVPPGPGTYSLGDNLTYMFKEPDWLTKLLVGGLLAMIPVVNFVTAGYGLQVINNLRGDKTPTLPKWGERFGDMWVDGLKLFVIGLIYSIPVWLISLVTGLPAAFLANATDDPNGFSVLAGGAACLGGLLSLIVGALILFWGLGAITNFAVNDGEFGAAFQFGKIWSIVKGNVGKMAMAVVAAVVASFLVGLLSSVLLFIPCLGWVAAWVIAFVSSFYILLVISYNCGYIAKTI